jgi:biopolymer transport protein ExbD
MATIADNKPEHLKLYIAAGAPINFEKNLIGHAPLDKAIYEEKMLQEKLLTASSKETSSKETIAILREKLANYQKIIQILKEAGAQSWKSL